MRLPVWFSPERRQERLEDGLADAEDRLAQTRAFHVSFGKRASLIREQERTVARKQAKLDKFLPSQPTGGKER